MNIVSLCSGIGAFERGMERAGLGRVVLQVEIDPFCRQVLARHWPKVQRLEDIRDEPPDGLWADILCAGFPCQPASNAGKRRGRDDPRWLWPHVYRWIERLQPGLVFIENVPGLVFIENVPGLVNVDGGEAFQEVAQDLERAGYSMWWRVVAASDVGAPHLRKRLWIVAAHADRARWVGWGGARIDHAGLAKPADACEALADADADGHGRERRTEQDVGPQAGVAPPCGHDLVGRDLRDEPPSATDAPSERLAFWRRFDGYVAEELAAALRTGGPAGQWLLAAPEPRVRRVDDGVAAPLDGPAGRTRRRIARQVGARRRDRVKALGNAVVGPIPEALGRAWLKAVDQ